jgi:hypothetical protein
MYATLLRRPRLFMSFADVADAAAFGPRRTAGAQRLAAVISGIARKALLHGGVVIGARGVPNGAPAWPGQ